MAGPRDLIHRAANRRAFEAEAPGAGCIPAPIQMSRLPQAPLQPGQKPNVQKPPVPGTSQVANWRTPPLTPERLPFQAEKAADDHERREPVERSEDHYRIVPRDIGGHAIYRNLMRSHDRMSTRHIQPRG